MMLLFLMFSPNLVRAVRHSIPIQKIRQSGISVKTGLWWNAGHNADTHDLFLWQDEEAKPQVLTFRLFQGKAILFI